MKRVLPLLVLAASLATALTLAGTAGGARECDGLQVCVPVAGPWVPVPPGNGVRRPEVRFQLSCPRRYVVGGVDAELSQRGIDVNFLGRLGSPINPGITTSRSVTFVATFVGRRPSSPTFRPHIGCMPSAGGGVRIPTSAAAFPPDRSTERRAKTVRVRPGTVTVVHRCLARERLVGATHAFGFYRRTPPGASLVSSVSGTRTVRDGRVLVRVRGDAELGGVRAVVQLLAVCTGSP